MRTNRLGTLFVAAVAACSSGGSGENPATKDTTTPQVQVKGTVADCVFAGVSCDGASPEAVQRDGRVLILAVDADANVYQTSTLVTGAFSLAVAQGKSYVIMFRDSAGRFLGTLIVNQPAAAQGVSALAASPTSLLAAGDLDLGLVTIDPETAAATSSNAAALAAAAGSSAIAGPEDVVYKGSTSSIALSLYMPPLVPGTVVVKRWDEGGCFEPGACYAVWKITSEFAGAPLFREVAVNWGYGVSRDWTGAMVGHLYDKQWKYLTATSSCDWKSEHRDRDGNPVVISPTYPDGCFPDVVEIGSGFTFGTAPYRAWASIRAAYDAVVFPDLDPALSLPALIVWNLNESENEPAEYFWIAKGLGEVLEGMPDPQNASTATPPAVFPPPPVADYLEYLPTDAGDTRYESRVVCKKTPAAGGGFTIVGTCPDWVTDEFVTGLPTTFPGD